MRKLLVIGIIAALCGTGLLTAGVLVAQEDQVPVSYLPFVAQDYTPPVQYSTHAAGSWHLLAQGADLADTLAGADIVLWRYDHHCRAINLPPDALRPRYGVERGFAVFDLADAPAGTVLTATLELYVLGQSDVQGEFLARFHQGTWTEPPTAADWDQYGPLLGAYDTAHWQQESPLWVPLPGLVGETVPERLYLVLRGDEETELAWGQAGHVANFALDLFDGTDYAPASRLHLTVAVTP